MKRVDLLRHLESHGCQLLREGAAHTVYVNRTARKTSTIPRHREIDDGLWEVYFGPLKLGRMDERILRIEDHKGRTVRKTVSPMSPD